MPPKGACQWPGARPLTSTSYAILGLLSLRPWTTYELAQQMQRALGQFWPRAESKLYEEPKKLVEHGLAKATVEHVGKRPRTVYAITPAGRKALQAWMPTPSEGPVIEFEGLVGCSSPSTARRPTSLAAIDSAHAWVDRRYHDSEGISAGLPRRRGRLPRATAMAHPVWSGSCQELLTAVERWAAWATRDRRWPSGRTTWRPPSPISTRCEAMAATSESDTGANDLS